MEGAEARAVSNYRRELVQRVIETATLFAFVLVLLAWWLAR